MVYTLPDLPYRYDALEPYIDAQTMEVHYMKHYKGYMDKLNNALEQYPGLQSKTLTWLLQNLNIMPHYLRTPIQHNGGGFYNHSIFWSIMSPDGGGEPTGEIAKVIHSAFGSFDEFKKQLTQHALHQFGSGWAWLAVGSEKQLLIMSTPNQDTPIMEGIIPILGVDVWEHAYYLKYQNERAKYVDAWWHVINWEQVAQNYQDALETRHI
jgi:Fe-Mn family superoxide dismutase